MNGMEMMFSSLMKAMGLKPEVITATIETMASGVQDIRAQLVSINARLTALEALQRGEVPPLIEHKPQEGESNGTPQN